MDFLSILGDIQKMTEVVNKARANLTKVLPAIDKYSDIIFAVLQPIAILLPPQYGTALQLIHKYGDTIIGYLKGIQIAENTEGIKGEDKLVEAVSAITECPIAEIKPIVTVVKQENGVVDTVLDKVEEGTAITQKIVSSIKGVQSIVDSINNLL